MKINFFLCFTSPSISLHFLDSGLKKTQKARYFWQRTFVKILRAIKALNFMMVTFVCISYIEMQILGRCGSIQYKDFRVYRTCWFTPGVAEVYSWVRNDSGIRSLLSSTDGSLTTVLWQIKIAGSTLTACIMKIPNFHGCEEWKIYLLPIQPLPASLSFFP